MALASGKWITPSEVHEIASRLRDAAEQIRSVYHVTTAVGRQLDESWAGNAKNIFDVHFGSFPREVLAYADRLEQMANEVLNIQVWVPDEPD